MTSEEKKLYVEELAKRGYEKATRVEGLFDELAIKSAKLKVELKGLKNELSDKLAEKSA
ncbi:hypothetical protein [Spirosoma agri]|uniref:Uncharacterized protein n=1 Tax=Spirosoma agri TaxID=1987381 RepID=A0A6M0INT8_9BACT|nr:hypothetical protein [Spirosoma agri]NEU69724.1 hypothetical protein [Spirosoma agri]